MLSTDHGAATFQEWSTLKHDLPDAEALLTATAAHQDPFEVYLKKTGFEIVPLTPVDGRPNRARLRVFPVAEGPMQGRLAVFFYKPSHIPHSKVRHSYGVCLIPVGGPAPEEAGEWLFFATSGLHPYARPSRLRLAFAFDVPMED